jgi:hypothetical protein
MSEKLPPLQITRPGIYRHYKNLLYQVIGTARHSESLEPMTVYRALYGDHGLWVRPAAMFNETVEIAGVVQPRFCWVAELPGAPASGSGDAA